MLRVKNVSVKSVFVMKNVKTGLIVENCFGKNVLFRIKMIN